MYTLEVHALAPGTFTLTVDSTSPDGRRRQETVRQDSVAAGVIDRYKLRISAAPDQGPLIVLDAHLGDNSSGAGQ